MGSSSCHIPVRLGLVVFSVTIKDGESNDAEKAFRSDAGSPIRIKKHNN